MPNIFYSWRFYTFRREQYNECMNKLFSNNLVNLCKINKIVALLAVIFSVFPVIFENNIKKTIVYIITAFIALVIYFISNYQMQLINVKNRVIYLLMTFYFTNIIIFGTYLDILSRPTMLSAIYPCILICSLLMFFSPARFNLVLTISAVLIYALSAFIFIPENVWFYLLTSILAGGISLYFNWHITKLRLGLEISTSMLEEEKNKYFDQSTVDELTQLKNRRDFMHTFQRYLSNYRSSDDWLCIAIADIDFFKYYNDHYGHPQGDVCLRSIGDVLNKLRDDYGVYSARVGGEEFAVLWFEKDITNIDNLIYIWTNMIRELEIPHEKSKVSDYITMSIGVYVSKCGSHYDMQTLYDFADKALYAAKGGGRNCTIVNGDEIKPYKITSGTK